MLDRPDAARERRHRAAWYRRRTEMEAGGARLGRSGPHSALRWRVFKTLLRIFGFGLRGLGLYGRGRRNALDLRLTRLELTFADLPEAFDGLRVLQLSDLHLDALPGTTAAARALISGLDVDLCVLTGDYRLRVGGPHEQILAPLSDLLRAPKARLGVYAILGNHDCAAMVADFERIGITVLVNETLRLTRGADALHLTGTDDVHYYYSEAAGAALREAPSGFKIALVHSPELADVAAAEGYQLYLTGHTHGGQISLPSGKPIITHLDRHRALARGTWRVGAMQGYTSTGVGVSGLPIRFNCPGEVALVILRRA